MQPAPIGAIVYPENCRLPLIVTADKAILTATAKLAIKKLPEGERESACCAVRVCYYGFINTCGCTSYPGSFLATPVRIQKESPVQRS
jgi:hypothetical protein